jgi:hypothetical protein
MYAVQELLAPRLVDSRNLRHLHLCRVLVVFHEYQSALWYWVVARTPDRQGYTPNHTQHTPTTRDPSYTKVQSHSLFHHI